MDDLHYVEAVRDPSCSTNTTSVNFTVTSNSQPATNGQRENTVPNNINEAAKKRAKRIVKNTKLEIEQQKIELLREKMKRQEVRESIEEDDDLHFLKSLLPHVKKIPEDIKLLFRNKVQELVQRFAYQSSISYNYASSCSSYECPNIDSICNSLANSEACGYINSVDLLPVNQDKNMEIHLFPDNQYEKTVTAVTKTVV
ncbi:uncharacterized protein LOC142327665 [Lycorma delicatula]|uniref:uncharacterized protein LOC142327665 n=1 Tax=Lycorma delicatula TaxID=130591 RepID=UPI003F514BEA